MIRRPVLLVLALALVGGLAADTPPVTDSGVMAVDRCDPGPDAYAVMLDAHDLCEVSMTVTTGEGVTPVVTATLRVADDVIPGSMFSTLWSVGDCVYQFHREDDAIAPTTVVTSRTRLLVGCGEAERVCTFWSNDPIIPVEEAHCRWVHRDGSVVANVPDPVVDGDTVTFTATLDGPFAPFAEAYVPGATLQQRGAYAAPDTPFFTGGDVGSVFICGLLEHCTYAGGDLVLGGGQLTLSE